MNYYENEVESVVKLQEFLQDSADQINQLISDRRGYYQLLEENEGLRRRIAVLEQDQTTLIKQKATEFCAEVEVEVLVKLAMKLTPIFGLTKPERYEQMVREYIIEMKKSEWKRTTSSPNGFRRNL
jgi:hypothetical protein